MEVTRSDYSTRRGTPLLNTKIPEAKALSIIEHLDQSCSITATANLVQVSKDTVARLLKAAGRHAQSFHDRLP